jgi:arylsulfatase A-like enzyme
MSLAVAIGFGSLLACAPERPDPPALIPVESQFASDTAVAWVPPVTIEDADDPTLVFAQGPPQNLLFIAVDTLRRDRIGRWDPELGTSTPFLDGLLSQSVVLENHRSCSNWTLSSLLCLFSGKSTVELGFEPLSGDDLAPPLPQELNAAPRWLADAGFRAVAISGSPYISPEWLTTDGFTAVEYQDNGGTSWASAEWIIDRATTHLADLQNSRDRWYLHLHFMDPHSPYSAPESYLDLVGGAELVPLPWDVTDPTSFGVLKSLYDGLDADTQANAYATVDKYYRADVRYLDDQLALFWEHLKSVDALDSTLVVFWTDHGEQFWEHGKIHHDKSLYGEENRATAAFWSKDLETQSWTRPTVHQDIFPTILQALDVPIAGRVSGDVLGTRTGGKIRTSFRYSSPEPAHMAADLEGLRLHYDWDGNRALYDTDIDPDEIHDLYDPEDPELAVLWARMETEIDRVLTFLPHLEPVDRGL